MVKDTTQQAMEKAVEDYRKAHPQEFYDEPWRLEQKSGDFTIYDANNKIVLSVDYGGVCPSPENTDRMIACVNAMEGVPDELLTAIKFIDQRGEKEVAEDRARVLKEARENFPDFEERFKPGSFGFFEIMDRSSIILANWFKYIADHPAVALDGNLFALAHRIGTLLHDFYQTIAEKEWNAEEKKEKNGQV